MKGLLCSLALLAALCSISCEDLDAATCMEETGMTPEQAESLSSGKPDKECMCFMGCMHEKKKGDLWDAVKPGSKEEEAKKCVDSITTTDRCAAGQEMFDCAKKAGVM